MSSAVFERPGPHRVGSSVRQKFIHALRWCSASAAVALALAGCGGGGSAVDTPSPTAAAPTQLDQVAALTRAQQAVNGRMATMPRPVALAAVSPATASEDFENGMADWSNWGNAQVVAGIGTSGSKALQVGTGAGGAGLAVPGIVAGNTYRLTAQVKVSDPADPVYIGINMLDGSGGQVIGHSSPAITSTGYVTVTVDLVAPANSANAVVWIWKNAGSGYAFLDDVSFGPPTSPPPPPTTAPGSNLVSNGGFESGMANWVNWGNASVSGQANSGTSALAVGTAAGGAGQSVTGITAGTVYRLVAQAKVSDPSETVFVGVNLLNQAGAAVAQMALPVSSTTYSTVTFDITAPADAVSAVVYVWKNAGSGLGYVDDVVFGVAPGAAPPPPPASGWRNLVANGGFEDGLANWVDWGNTTISTDAASGASAAQVGTAAGGFGQTIGGIVPGTAYSLSAQVKVSIPIELGYLGLKFMDDAGNVLAMNYVTFNSSRTYATAQVHLAAPANATKALVYVWKDAGYGFASVDQVALAQQVTGTPGTAAQVSPAGGAPIPAAQLAGGGHVVVWTAGSTSPSVYAQIFDANGQKQGAPITVFAAPAGSTSGTGFLSSGVTGLPDGSFLVSGNKSQTQRGSSALFVQKVSATGQLLASGGVSDPSVNGGLADRVLFDTDFNTLGFSGGPFFVNPDGSYVLAVTKTAGAVGTPPSTRRLLLNVDAAGSAVGAPVDIGANDYISAPDVVRLAGGNFMVAGTTSNFPSASAVIKIVTNTGQEIGRQTLEFVDFTPAIAPLADGTGMVAWSTSSALPSGPRRGERLDASGNVVALAAVASQYGRVTGLAPGGYLFTWTSGAQVMGQYFTTSGQVASDAFVVVDNLDTTSAPGTFAPYRISPTPDGFSIVYLAGTANGPQIVEVRTSVPALN